MPSEPAVRYSSICPRIEVSLTLVALRSATEASGRSGWNETGGILLGRYEEGGIKADILEVTSMPRGSMFGRSWFRRGADGLSELLRAKWEQGLHYVGEWHSHPGSAPEPSRADVAVMATIAGDSRYECAAPILLIVGGDPPGRFSISLSVMLRNETIRLRYWAPASGFPRR